MTSSDTSKGSRKKRWLLGVLIVVVLLAGVGGYRYLTQGRPWLYGIQAYVYGFSMIMMDLTREAATLSAPRYGRLAMTRYYGFSDSL